MISKRIPYRLFFDGNLRLTGFVHVLFEIQGGDQHMTTPTFIMVIISFFIGLLGANRRLGFWGYFFGSLLLTPFVGLILVVASDPKK